MSNGTKNSLADRQMAAETNLLGRGKYSLKDIVSDVLLGRVPDLMN